MGWFFGPIIIWENRNTASYLLWFSKEIKVYNGFFVLFPRIMKGRPVFIALLATNFILNFYVHSFFPSCFSSIFSWIMFTVQLIWKSIHHWVRKMSELCEKLAGRTIFILQTKSSELNGWLSTYFTIKETSSFSKNYIATRYILAYICESMFPMDSPFHCR